MLRLRLRYKTKNFVDSRNGNESMKQNSHVSSKERDWCHLKFAVEGFQSKQF